MDVKNNKVDANGKKRKYIYESRYQQIAVELAQKIADGWYTIGEKISARSTLASNYNVSPETARKAVNILVDLGIVTIRQGSGTYVASREKAHLFVERYQNTVSMQEIRREISDCVNRQQEELAALGVSQEELPEFLENLRTFLDEENVDPSSGQTPSPRRNLLFLGGCVLLILILLGAAAGLLVWFGKRFRAGKGR